MLRCFRQHLLGSRSEVCNRPPSYPLQQRYEKHGPGHSREDVPNRQLAVGQTRLHGRRPDFLPEFQPAVQAL